MKKILISLVGISILLVGCANRKKSNSEISESSFSNTSEIESSTYSSREESSTISEYKSESSSISESSYSSSSQQDDDFDYISSPSIRMPGEFEPVQAVTTIYPINMNIEVYKEIAKDDKMIVLVNPDNRDKSRIEEARTYFSERNLNMDNITLIDCPSDNDGMCWIRDCSPFYVFNDESLTAVDFNYNRPARTEQNNIPKVLSNYLSFPYKKMDITHTGGNLMQDGRGAAMSDDLVISENNNNENKVRNLMNQYTGVDNYHITIDPQGDYIAHIDCWGKIVAPDKIIIAELPEDNPRYQYYEEVADYFAKQNCCYGYPYRIYRIQEPGDVLAPYTNSLILNHKVLLPLGSDDTYNQKAIATYQEALPGYDIIGIKGSLSNGWLNTDALHCRTHEIPDENMLFINHMPLYGEVDNGSVIRANSDLVSYANSEINSASITYKVNDGNWHTYPLSKYKDTTNYYFDFTNLKSGDEVSYYIEAIDNENNYNIEPTCGSLDPHHFIVR